MNKPINITPEPGVSTLPYRELLAINAELLEACKVALTEITDLMRLSGVDSDLVRVELQRIILKAEGGDK